MGVWGGSGTEWGPESIQNPPGQNSSPHVGGHFGASLTSKIWSFFCCFLKGSFLALWAPLGSSWGGKWCQKAPKRCPKVIILRLEWISENSCFTIVKLWFLRFWRSLGTTWKPFLKWKRPKELSKGVRGCHFADFVRFLRFRGSLWEAIFGWNSELFSDSIFYELLVNFWVGAGGRGGLPLSLKNLRNWGTASVELARPSHPAGWGRILRLRPCRRPLWQPVDCLFAY